MTPFDFVNDITSDKKYLFDEQTEGQYVPFVINKTLSFSVDTILMANFVNENNHLDKEMQHDLLWFGVRKKPKKFHRWPKKDAKNLNMIQRLYNCNERNATQIAGLLTQEQLNIIEEIEESLNNAYRKSTRSTRGAE